MRLYSYCWSFFECRFYIHSTKTFKTLTPLLWTAVKMWQKAKLVIINSNKCWIMRKLKKNKTITGSAAQHSLISWRHAINIQLFFLLRGNAYTQEQTDTNSQPHLYANCVKESLATLSQTWVKICFLTAVFSQNDVPQGFTWRCGLGFLLAADAAAPSSEPWASNKSLAIKSPTLATTFSFYSEELAHACLFRIIAEIKSHFYVGWFHSPTSGL